MNFELIHTERLVLRKLTPDVYNFVFEKYSKKEIQDFFDLQTEEEYEKELNRYQKGMTTFNKSFVFFQLIEKISGEIIGGCGFHTWYLDHRRAEIGYALKEDTSKAKGIMTEAMIPIIAYGFEKMNLHRIEAFIGPNNLPSLKLVEKLNFKKEGHLKEHFFKNGNFEDSLVYALFK